MGSINTPGEFDCLAKLQANPDMPSFVLLPTDPCAITTILWWAASREEAIRDGVIPDTERQRRKIIEARACVQKFTDWQTARAKAAAASPELPAL